MSKHIDTTGMSAVVASLAVAMGKDGVLPELLGSEDIKTDQDKNIRAPLMKLDTAIHANAVQCILHAHKHGDTSLMTRLLVDIVDDKSGYRRQGLIAWMRRFTPMELSGKVIKLTGTINGKPIPWDILTASRTSFRDIPEFGEMIIERPMFKGGFVNQITRALKAYRESVENTLIKDGRVVGPIDPKKPYYSGLHLDKMDEIFDSIKASAAKFETFSDDTAEVAAARKSKADAERYLAEKEKALETQGAELPKGA